ncbi:hypothetical protein TROPICALSUN_78 [Erwinia phage vB_EamM_TropicalSun]|jgi:hypothetical protein|uniref:Uncharacterized protein n=2 Tax=Myosmarvirus myosmar TaxID=2846183 RepID=A0A5B9NIQ3_9CAUD|nr:hypothetical protein HWC56_gp016 [Serratia phage MyoSmar]QEG09465.1 hypothetical protein CPT_MyoSmar_016 [Serratia phage MyoSmar]QEG13868.1 hypothetical protein TROPICALSUN_78 [Erwinia phage vB_EamM_TropicalSun]
MDNYEANLRVQLLMTNNVLATLSDMNKDDQAVKALWNINSNIADGLRSELAACLKTQERIEAGNSPVIPPYVSPLSTLEGLTGLGYSLKTCDGKYETFMGNSGMYSVRRNGESWLGTTDTCGNGYQLSLLQMIEKLDHKCKYYSDLAIKAAK